MFCKFVVRALMYVVLCFALCAVSCSSRSFKADERLAEGEHYFKLGTSSNQMSRYEESAYYLKQAEDIFLSVKQSELSEEQRAKCNNMLGLTWFHLGNTAESDMLYDIAREYYRKSIPLLLQHDNTLYLACAYRDLARTLSLTGAVTDSVLWYFSKAEQMARLTDSQLLLQDIAAYRYQLCYPDSVEQRLAVCRSLAQCYGAHARYSEMVELFLAARQTDSAAYYLQFLQPVDSSYTYWFEQSYIYLHTKILRQQSKNGDAYDELVKLYDSKIDDLQRDAGARTYALSLHYDVEREKQVAQDAHRERQFQRMVSIFLVLLLLVVLVLLFVLWRYWLQRRKEQAKALQALQEKYTQQLQLALERLQQKVNLTREIELQRLRGKEVEFPKWLQTFRDEQLTMSKESLDKLISSVDSALDGAISRLRHDFPALTESDMQFAILSIIGASDSDMGILLNVQKQTIYHRRQIVRKHILAGMGKATKDSSANSEIANIDAWLRDYVLQKDFV